MPNNNNKANPLTTDEKLQVKMLEIEAEIARRAEVAATAEEYADPIEWELMRPSGPKGILTKVVCEENFDCLLNEYDITIRYNSMSKGCEVNIPGRTSCRDIEENATTVMIQDYARKHTFGPPMGGHILSFMLLKASQNEYNPVKDWILSKEWDGVDRYSDIVESMDTPQEELALILMRRWLISGVVAVFNPRGVASQGVLTLCGRQGIRKTRWLKSLSPDSDWFKEGVVLDVKNKDSILLICSRWIVELGEIEATFSKSGQASLKAFITNDEDVIRPPFAKKADKYPRRTIFCGSVNDANFLQESENRRMWVIAVNSLNPKHGVNIQQLWAQAYHDWSVNKERHWLTPEEDKMLLESNVHFNSIDPLIQKFEDNFVLPDDDESTMTVRLNATAICEHIQLRNYGKRETNRLSDHLRISGFEMWKSNRTWKLGLLHSTAVPGIGYHDGNI